MKIEINVEFLSTFLGKTAGEITSALKEGDDLKPEKEIESYLKKELQAKLVQAKVDGKNESYGRAKKEVLNDLEKSLSEAYGVEEYKDVEDIVSQVKQLGFKEAEPKEITESDIKNSDVYQTALKAEIEKREAAIKELEDVKNTFTNYKRTRQLRSNLHTLLPEQFRMPEDAKIFENQLSGFVTHLLNSANFDFEAGKVTDKEGHLIKDENLNVVGLNDYLLKQAGSFFEKKEPDRESPNLGQQKPNYANGKPMEENEFRAKLRKTTTSAERQALLKAYKGG